MNYKRFAENLTVALKKHYGGKIPSFSRIARDFALNSPASLPPISVETPRKWVRGESLPSLERLHTLANWLGPEILDPLNGSFLNQTHQAESGHSTEYLADIARLLEDLHPEQLNSVRQLLHLWVKTHFISRQDHN